MLHAWCEYGYLARAPTPMRSPREELVPVQSTRQRQHLVSSTVLERTGASNCSILSWKRPPWLPSLEGYLHRVRLSSRRTACGMGVPPPSSSLSSLSSCSLAAANDTRDAIALSRRASPRPSELGIALVFPALTLPRTVWHRRRSHVARARGSRLDPRPRTSMLCPRPRRRPQQRLQGPRLVSSPLPARASILPQSRRAGVHRPTATRRLPSRRTTLDAGATAASLHPRATWRHSEALSD